MEICYQNFIKYTQMYTWKEFLNGVTLKQHNNVLTEHHRLIKKNKISAYPEQEWIDGLSILMLLANETPKEPPVIGNLCHGKYILQHLQTLNYLYHIIVS